MILLLEGLDGSDFEIVFLSFPFAHINLNILPKDIFASLQVAFSNLQLT
jgi:hypothetical protein